MVKKAIPFLIILLVVCVFFWKSIFQSQIAMPGDLLSGAYYPWLEYKYGYEVGVPVKNGLISDVFSQFYIWKKLIVESYQAGQFPLWNPYSYSGYPLLANFHSGSLYLLNFLFTVTDFKIGWNLFCIAGILGSAFSMYLLLKLYGYKTEPSLIGAIAYAFSGFSIAWMQFATAGQSLIWLPLIFVIIEKYFITRQKKWILLLSPILFLLTTAGHFQIMVYGYILTGAYFLYKYVCTPSKSYKDLLLFLAAFSLGIGFSAIQLLPTLEMSTLSVRFEEHYIELLNYGLIPVKNLVTLFAPDFFGNPATGNYWGFWNYHESILYLGIPSLFALVWFLSNYSKTNIHERFFLVTAFISLMLCIDTPIGKTIYFLNFPGISTSAAGRIVSIFALSSSILLASFAENTINQKAKVLIKHFFVLTNIIFIFVFGVILAKCNLLGFVTNSLNLNPEHLNVGFRNILFPLLLFVAFSIVLTLRKTKYFYTLFILLLVTDLFRFGWKYTPFVKKDLVFPETEITNFLQRQDSLFRVDKVFGPILPPNTWSYYHLMSSSGYDPMGLKDYSIKFYKDLSQSDNLVSRYAEIHSYDPATLGKYNIKYLLNTKVDKEDNNFIDYGFDGPNWSRVFETNKVEILENKKAKDRAFLESYEGKMITGKTVIKSYKPNEIFIEYESPENANLVLLDSYYPGWKAKLDGHELNIKKYDEVFRMVSVPKGKGDVIFEYQPDSFKYGWYTTTISFLIWIGLQILIRLRIID